MKNIFTALLLAISVSAVASPVTQDALNTTSAAINNQCEQICSSDFYSLSRDGDQSLKGMLLAGSDVGQCMGACASEQGICIGQCQGNGQCIANCSSAHGRCVARCH